MVSKRKNQRATLIHAHRRSRQLLVPRPVLLLLLLCGLVFVLFFLLFLGAALRVAIRHSSNVFEQEINGLFGACSPSLSSDAGADTSVAATRTVLIFLCVCCASLIYYDPYMYIQVIELGLSRLEKQRLGSEPKRNGMHQKNKSKCHNSCYRKIQEPIFELLFT